MARRDVAGLGVLLGLAGLGGAALSTSRPEPPAPLPASQVRVSRRPAPQARAIVRYDAAAARRSAPYDVTMTAEREAVIERVLTVLGDGAPPDASVEYVVHTSAQSKALTTRSERWAHTDPVSGTLHVLIDDMVRGDRLGLEAPLLFGRALGPPGLPILEEGLAAFFSDDWGRRGFEYWAARLHSARLVPSLATILDPEWAATSSPLIVQPIAGVLVAHLIGRWSRVGFVDRYSSWRPSVREADAMELGWQAFLDAVLRRNREAIRRDRAVAEDRRASRIPQIRGVNYAHEGYRTYDGYLSHRSDTSLVRLVELGANGVAVLPYTVMASPSEPAPLRPPTRLGAETDEAVIRAVQVARREGLTVLLKPHIWLRGSWPGEIRMRSRRDWRRFFEEYERWILHYALLAEIHQVPLFAVGVELSEATLRQERRWEELAARVRQVYSGALVYAANWGKEFESLEFWAAFDYLGVDAYYPLSDDPNATNRDLRLGAEAMLDRIEAVHRRYDKPVLLTEIGFASTPGSWVRPWEGHELSRLSTTDQVRSYRAVIDAMDGRDWIGGVFWWEWPSDLRRAEGDRRGFMPAGKPAEALLEAWFRGVRVGPSAESASAF